MTQPSQLAGSHGHSMPAQVSLLAFSCDGKILLAGADLQASGPCAAGVSCCSACKTPGAMQLPRTRTGASSPHGSPLRERSTPFLAMLIAPC